ncbi:MAG: DUF2971 domain-containing protein, partial [Pacificimonas sp.]
TELQCLEKISLICKENSIDGIDLKVLRSLADKMESIFPEFEVIKHHQHDGVLEELRDNIKNLIGSGIEYRPPGLFITSFCKSGDLLSQWRGYAHEDQGISIGFDSVTLRKLNATASLSPVLYGEEAEPLFKWFKESISLGKVFDNIHVKFEEKNYKLLNDEEIFAEDIGGLDGTQTIHESIRLALPKLVRVESLMQGALIMAASIKRTEFSEEDEWRLTTHKRNPKFLVTNNRLRPYQELLISDCKKERAIREIIVGPHVHQKKNYDILREMIPLRFGIDVSCSSIPLV